jgi:hypothetical protein
MDALTRRPGSGGLPIGREISQMIIYHHNDLDGKCAAAIVGKAAESGRMCEFVDGLGSESEIFYKYREVDYKDNPVFDKEVRIGELVVIVDFSFKPEKMAELLLLTDRIIWIDHHETAADYHYYNPNTGNQLINFDGIRDFSKECKKSGCELAWEYFFQIKPKNMEGLQTPEAVRL